ncbi:MAG: hypothetical protein BIFFINMI_01661 [Phycisphaerae bacterium]|nr:hypothetical protein [Phycisphaerae bacterium]
MSLEHLKHAGVLLPKEQWGEKQLRSRVPRWLLVACGLSALAGCAVMYFGDGGGWTWAGLGLFFVSLAGFGVLNLRGISEE